METITPSYQETLQHQEIGQAFSIVILYEDFVTGKRAKQTYDYLVDHLGRDCDFKNNMWKFDVLRLAKLKEMAAREASEADMVIISMHGHNDLPEEIKEWLDLWMELRGSHPAALVTLFDCPPYRLNDEGSPCAYFREVAHKAGLDFFFQTHDAATEARTETCHMETTDRTPALHANILHQLENTPNWDLRD